MSQNVEKITALFQALAVEFDREYQALVTESLALLRSCQLRQADLQRKIDTYMHTGAGTSGKLIKIAGHSAPIPMQTWLKMQVNNLQGKIRRNIQLSSKIKVQTKNELNQVGKAVSSTRNILPKILQFSAPEISELRR